ncbi:ABC transporter substrate-binding protein [Acidihalobacter prosperus]|uniref:Peptide ABC transporter substrate-binding protein n=1 Tax=Acidihalobacter prosperus TaxID=160660 RepID=A0A1A6C107_9GAMM|nr:ABC transporter substrate-binding protein [Acidihalobacter prosperus]OBS08240.1 peptide ABC transporter substrate-binding protein [Acidihalobacter prosperus]
MTRRKWVRVLAVGLAVLSLAGVRAFAATPANVLVIGKAADPQTLDPDVTMDNNDWTVTYPAYQRLVRYETIGGKGSTQVVGQLARSWKVSKNKLTWTFELKSGERFADGSPVDASAVKFSFDRLLKLGKGPAEPFHNLASVMVIGPHTVRFRLKQPFAPFLYTLANDGAAIINPKVMVHQVNGDMAQGWLAEHTAGSGAYQLRSWQKGQSLIMTPNAHYAGPKPHFAEVVVKIVPDASARRLQLERGDLDIAENLPADQLNAIKKAGTPGVSVREYPSLKVTYLYLNNKRPPLDKVAVRRAIIDAVDARAIIAGILNGEGKPMGAPIPDGMWGYDPSLKPATRDVAKARVLLKEAGASDLKLRFDYSDADPNWATIALAVQANLADAGIAVKLENFANATYRDRLGKGDFDIAIGNWSPDFADPYMFMNYWFDSANGGLAGNRSFYANPEVDQLVRKAAVAATHAERLRLYRKAQRIAVQDAAYVYLFQKNSQIAMRKDVKGFVFNPMLEQIYNIAEMSKSH